MSSNNFFLIIYLLLILVTFCGNHRKTLHLTPGSWLNEVVILQSEVSIKGACTGNGCYLSTIFSRIRQGAINRWSAVVPLTDALITWPDKGDKQVPVCCQRPPCLANLPGILLRCTCIILTGR